MSATPEKDTSQPAAELQSRLDSFVNNCVNRITQDEADPNRAALIRSRVSRFLRKVDPNHYRQEWHNGVRSLKLGAAKEEEILNLKDSVLQMQRELSLSAKQEIKPTQPMMQLELHSEQRQPIDNGKIIAATAAVLGLGIIQSLSFAERRVLLEQLQHTLVGAKPQPKKATTKDVERPQAQKRQRSPEENELIKKLDEAVEAVKEESQRLSVQRLPNDHALVIAKIAASKALSSFRGERKNKKTPAGGGAAAAAPQASTDP
jgi:hypothetical protein